MFSIFSHALFSLSISESLIHRFSDSRFKAGLWLRTSSVCIKNCNVEKLIFLRIYMCAVLHCFRWHLTTRQVTALYISHYGRHFNTRRSDHCWASYSLKSYHHNKQTSHKELARIALHHTTLFSHTFLERVLHVFWCCIAIINIKQYRPVD